MELRAARVSDAPAIRQIYAPFVLETAVSFETEVPSAAEMEERIRTVMVTHPWLVACEGEQVLGFAYAGLHRARKAYQWTAETSVYVAPEGRRTGVATRLYRALLALLREQGFATVLAGATVPNEASIRFHESAGFKSFAVFERVGQKFGQWHDTQWMILHLREGAEPPPEIVPFPELDPAVLARCLGTDIPV